MSESPQDSQGSLQEVHTVMVAGLRSRSAEVASTIGASIPAPESEVAKGELVKYHAGRLRAVAATVEYSLDAIERGDCGEDWPPIPRELTAQARRAARAGVRPGLLVRRFLAGHRQFMSLVGEELRRGGHSNHEAVLEHTRARYRSLLEHIVASVEHAYHEEHERVAGSPEQRHIGFVREARPLSERDRIRIVGRILTGSATQSEIGELRYPIHVTWHVGMIAVGPRSAELLRDIESQLGLMLLAVPCGDLIWAWLGSRRVIGSEKILRAAAASPARDTSLAIGTPLQGLDGWRQTHSEAQRALSHVLRLETKRAQYADNPLVTTALEDDTLNAWLKRLLHPIVDRPDGGVTLLEALRAYIDAGFNHRAAAAALGRNRHTIENRIRLAEEQLGRPVRSCVSELDTALRLIGMSTAIPRLIAPPGYAPPTPVRINAGAADAVPPMS